MAAKTVDEYLSTLPAEHREIITALRAIVRKAAPRTSEAVKWAQPVYESNGPMIFIKAHKTHVNFGFWRGAQLTDPKGLLQGDGDRMRHVKLASVQDINQSALTRFVKQAVKLNQEFGDPTKGRMNR